MHTDHTEGRNKMTDTGNDRFYEYGYGFLGFESMIDCLEIRDSGDQKATVDCRI